MVLDQTKSTYDDARAGLVLELIVNVTIGGYYEVIYLYWCQICELRGTHVIGKYVIHWVW